jgi:hypothetical protein
MEISMMALIDHNSLEEGLVMDGQRSTSIFGKKENRVLIIMV